MNVILMAVVCFAAASKEHLQVLAQPDVLETGLAIFASVVAKGKEIIDHGVSLQSERQQSIDFFGLKFGTNNGVNSGFGEAVGDKTVSSAEDDLTRKKRSPMLESYGSTGLLPNTAIGSNVNFVTINSVINVNHYAPAEVSTPAPARRKRLTNDEQSSKVFYMRNKHKTRTRKTLEQKRSEDEPLIRNRRSVNLSISNDVNSNGLLPRLKRSPQEATTLSGPMGDSTDRLGNGDRKPEGPPPRDGRPRGGPPGGRGRGPPGGRCCCRGRRPPPSEADDAGEDDTEEGSTVDDARSKREVNGRGSGANKVESNSMASDSYSDTESSESDENKSTSQPKETSSNSQHLQRNKRSPCKGGGRARMTTTTAVPARVKREMSSEETADKAASWFASVVDVIVSSAKKVVEVTRKVFGGKDEQSGTSDVETMN